MQAVGRERAGEERGPAILGEAPVRGLRALDPANAVGERGLGPAAEPAGKRRERLREELRGDVGVYVPAELALGQRAGILHRDLIGWSALDGPHHVLDRAPRVRLELAARSRMAQAQKSDARDGSGGDVGALGMHFRSPAPVGVLRRDHPRERPIHVRLGAVRGDRVFGWGRMDRGTGCGDEGQKKQDGGKKHGSAARYWHGEPLSGFECQPLSTRRFPKRSDRSDRRVVLEVVHRQLAPGQVHIEHLGSTG